jgi:signal transduction histidine kinase
MAKIDSHELRLYREPVLLATVVESVLETVQSALAERNLSFRAECLSDLPPLLGDADALRKVFYHLVINAIKYTPDHGSIIVTGRHRSQGTDVLARASIQMTVGDTGIGIDPTLRELIFTKFYQTGTVALHSTGRTKFKGGGPGLGLTIAKGIIEAHQGLIWAESAGYDEVNCPGSQFHVLLPLHSPG